MAAFLEITTVSHCKNVCTYCPQSLLLRTYGKKEFMTLDTFQKCIDKLPTTVTIDFAGFVEPLLNPDCTKMVKYASDKGHPVRFYSTLVNCHESDIEILKTCRLNSIVLHLPDNDGHMTATVDDEYVRIATMFRKAFEINEAHVFGTLHANLRELFPDHVERTLTNQHLHTRANNVQNSKYLQLDTHPVLTGKLLCGVVWRENTHKLEHNVLLPNGNVIGCCFDYGLENIFGNLLTDNYEDLFTSNAYNSMKNAMNSEDEYVLCRTCKEAYPDQPFRN